MVAFPTGVIDTLLVTSILLVKGTNSDYPHGCPDNLLSEVLSCLANLTQGSDMTMLIGGGDAEQMKRHCRSGGFDDSVECLKKIEKQCTTPREREELRKLADHVAWTSGFQRFCEFVDLYTDKKTCMKKQNDLVTACVTRNQEVFTTHLSEEETKYESAEAEKEQKYDKLCRVFYWINYCLNSPIGAECGPVVGPVLTDFIYGIRPPLCRDFKINSAPKCIVNIGVILTFLTVVFYVIQS